MEDVAKALEMAGAMLIFVIAISVTFFIVNKAKSTADIIFAASDPSEFYEYISEADAPNANITRKVSIETVIPTLYRYNNEPIRIIIIDKNEIVQIFDTAMDRDIEIIWREKDNIDDVEENDSNTEIENTILEILGRMPEYDVLKDKIGIESEKELLKKYIECFEGNVVGGAMYIVPWNDNENINKRVDLFISGTNNTGYEMNGTKLLYDGFLREYQDSIFEESIIKYKTSGKYTDEGTVISQGEDKTIIIYDKDYEEGEW